MEIKVSINPSLSALGQAISGVDVQSFLRDEINKFAALVERYGKQLSPVRTGFLRASIHTSPASSFLQAVVSTGTNYAIFVHEGTRFMRARPFMGEGAKFAEEQTEERSVGSRLEQKFVEQFKRL